MGSRRSSSIERKVKIVILSICLVVLLLTCAGFLTYEFISFRQRIVGDLETKAQIVSANSTAALVFDNREDAREVLKAFRSQPRILSAAIYDGSDRLFASYTRDAVASEPPASPEEPGVRFEEGRLVLFQPIMLDKSRIGTMFLESDLQAMYQRFTSYGVVVLIVFGGAIIIAFVAASKLQKRISQPILDLARTAERISKENDYSIRAVKTSDDETGLLADAMNQMMIQIHDRDITLQRANEEIRKLNEELEHRIQKRTEQLEASNRELQNEIAERVRMEESLRASEEMTRMIIDTAYDAFIAIDAEGIVINWNEQAQSTFGWSRGEAVGQPLAGMIIPPRYREAHKNGLRHFLATGEGPVLNKRIELTALHRKGREFPVELTIRPIRVGKTYTFNAVLRDITQGKQEEEALKQLNSKLGTANKELEAFSYSISHDLRAPLRHIDGFAEMLLKNAAGSLDDRSRRHLTLMSQAARKMGTMIDELLVFSRMGRAELQNTPIALKQMVKEVLDDFRDVIDKRNVDVKLDLLPEIRGDPSMLRLVFENLISNALKYTSTREHARIEIASVAVNNEVEIMVRDNGVGFDMEYSNKLFGVFQRLHRVEEFEGTGIGLANVRRIVERHGGRTWAEGSVGKGATFHFSIPNNAEKGS